MYANYAVFAFHTPIVIGRLLLDFSTAALCFHLAFCRVSVIVVAQVAVAKARELSKAMVSSTPWQIAWQRFLGIAGHRGCPMPFQCRPQGHTQSLPSRFKRGSAFETHAQLFLHWLAALLLHLPVSTGVSNDHLYMKCGSPLGRQIK